jgi:hypothetical protein
MAEKSKARKEVRRRTAAARRKVEKSAAAAKAAAADPDLERLDIEISWAEKKADRLKAKRDRTERELLEALENLGALRRIRARVEGRK